MKLLNWLRSSLVTAACLWGLYKLTLLLVSHSISGPRALLVCITMVLVAGISSVPESFDNARNIQNFDEKAGE